MRFPTAILEGKKLPRVIVSVRQSAISSLMKEAYEMGAWSFDLPSVQHLQAFRDLRHLTEDEALTGLCHLEAEEGVAFLGKPLHRFEAKLVETIRKNLISSLLPRDVLPPSSSSDVFTQKEIDRIAFDPVRFDRALSLLNPEDSPFLMIGERYGDWLLALGRIDLLKEMIARVREKEFIPIFSGQWATFSLPKAKSLDVAAYAVPINKRWGLFDRTQACDLIKKFDRPVLSLNPLDDGRLLGESQEALSFLFEELKIYLAIAKIDSEVEAKKIFEAAQRFPSLIPPRKA
jgi:hypothetical protein